VKVWCSLEITGEAIRSGVIGVENVEEAVRVKLL